MALTHQRLKEVLSYDPESGHFFWLNPASNRVRRGDCAGTLGLNGYIYIGVDGKRYLAHRLAMFYMEGCMPADMVDHINGISTDNRNCNLRHASVTVNNENRRGAQANNSIGVLGVSPSRGKFKAQIQVSGNNLFLGRFSTIESAQAAYIEARRALHEGNTL